MSLTRITVDFFLTPEEVEFLHLETMRRNAEGSAKTIWTPDSLLGVLGYHELWILKFKHEQATAAKVEKDKIA